MNAKTLTLAPGNAGHCTPQDVEFLADLRKVLKGSGFTLWRRGRNRNRRQFAGQVAKVVTHGKEYEFARSARMLRQSLPVGFADRFGLYVVPTRKTEEAFRALGADWHKRNEMTARAAGRIDAVRLIYAIHGKPIA